eukprot:gene16561-7984_t
MQRTSSKGNLAEELLLKLEKHDYDAKEPWRCLAAWFLGPKAENRVEFNKFALSILNDYEDFRATYQPTDPLYITEDVRHSPSYEKEIEKLGKELKKLIEELKKSVPFFSYRYKGHMVWDISLPSLLGYLSGMLWNQNNVDSSTSPVTTLIEARVGRQLCEMFGFRQDDEMKPWGHITSCGSVSNIEALWAARNLKFHPIALRNAVANDARLAIARETTLVYLPRLDKYAKLVDADNWSLLNMEIDDVCHITTTVAEQSGLSMKAVTAILDDYSQVSLGLFDFLKLNGINSPVIISPATNHYSWPKAVTLLGLGRANLIQVPVDNNGRQNLEELQRLLESCLKNKIPVLCVVAIIGTTEESAVDPVVDILEIRDRFKIKGLNFWIHADAAWGGYLMTMLREPIDSGTKESERSKIVKENWNIISTIPRRTHSIPSNLDRGQYIMRSLVENENISHKRNLSTRYRHEVAPSDFVPDISLSPYVIEQYQALRMVDTITVDPHKAGFCVYPSGALCYRNGSMRSYIALAAPEVYHGEDDPSVGVYGLEGSKPGAAATSVLLSHNVIGLNKLGYGRILGQCTFATKLFYCMWMTIAQDDDPFVCVNFIDSHQGSMEDMKKFIRTKIHGKTNKEIFQDKEAMTFLAEVGPDALINTFVVNIKNEDGSLNTDINIANDLQSEIFKELSGRVGLPTKRIPMYLTTSEFNTKKYGVSLDAFKERLGLEDITKCNLKFLRNTVMNPFQSTNGFVEKIGAAFHNTVLNCIGKIKDKPYNHEFVSSHMSKSGTLYCSNLPSFTHSARRYHIVIRLQMVDRLVMSKLRQMQKVGKVRSIILKTSNAMQMHDIVRSQQDIEFDMFICQQQPQHDNQTMKLLSKNVKLVVDDVFRYEHLRPHALDIDYPVWQKYFLFGNLDEVYITHCMTKKEDFFQLVRLDHIPHSLSAEVVDTGVEITILGVHGSPLMYDGVIQDPLQAERYQVILRSFDDIEIRTEIGLHTENAKIWFQELE